MDPFSSYETLPHDTTNGRRTNKQISKLTGQTCRMYSEGCDNKCTMFARNNTKVLTRERFPKSSVTNSLAMSLALLFRLKWTMGFGNQQVATKKSKCNINKVKDKVACAARLIIQRRAHTYQMTERRNATLFWHYLPHLYFKANAQIVLRNKIIPSDVDVNWVDVFYKGRSKRLKHALYQTFSCYLKTLASHSKWISSYHMQSKKQSQKLYRDVKR